MPGKPVNMIRPAGDGGIGNVRCRPSPKVYDAPNHESYRTLRDGLS